MEPDNTACDPQNTSPTRLKSNASYRFYIDFTVRVRGSIAANTIEVDYLDDPFSFISMAQYFSPENATAAPTSEEQLNAWKRVGRSLADIIMPDEANLYEVSQGSEGISPRKRFLSACQGAWNRDKGIRLRILADASDLRNAPWEAIWVDDLATEPRLACDEGISLVRSSDWVSPTRSLFDGERANVLLVASRRGSTDYGCTDIPNAVDDLRIARRRMKQKQSAWVSVADALEDPTSEELHGCLAGKRPNAVVVFGHGILLDSDKNIVRNPLVHNGPVHGCLLLAPCGVGVSKNGDPLALSEIAKWNDVLPPRLWIFVNCNLAWSVSDFLTHVRQRTVDASDQGRAVLAMQSLLTVKDASNLLVDFAQWVGEGESLEVTTVQLRRRLLEWDGTDEHGAPWWIAPVLHLDAADGSLGRRDDRAPAPALKDYMAWLKDTHDLFRPLQTDFFNEDHQRYPRTLSMQDSFAPARIESEVPLPGGDHVIESKPLPPAHACGVFDLFSNSWTDFHARILLVGAVGSGKSLMLQHACYGLACKRRPVWYPVYIKMRELSAYWRETEQESKTPSLNDFVDRKLHEAQPHWPETSGALIDAIHAEHPRDSRILLLIDNLEEFAEPTPEDRVQKLLDEINMWPGPVVMTTTPDAPGVHSDPIRHWTSYRVCLPGDALENCDRQQDGSGNPFEEFMKQFLGPRLVDDRQRAELVHEFCEQWDLLKDFRRPLLLELVAALKFQSPKSRISEDQEELLECATRFLICRKPPFDNRAQDLPFRLLRALEAVGWILVDMAESFSEIQLQASLASAFGSIEGSGETDALRDVRFFNELNKYVAGNEWDSHRLAKWLVELSGLIEPAGAGQYRFFSTAFRDYLVFRGLKKAQNEVIFKGDEHDGNKRLKAIRVRLPALRRRFDVQGGAGDRSTSFKDMLNNIGRHPPCGNVLIADGYNWDPPQEKATALPDEGSTLSALTRVLTLHHWPSWVMLFGYLAFLAMEVQTRGSLFILGYTKAKGHEVRHEVGYLLSLNVVGACCCFYPALRSLSCVVANEITTWLSNRRRVTLVIETLFNDSPRSDRARPEVVWFASLKVIPLILLIWMVVTCRLYQQQWQSDSYIPLQKGELPDTIREQDEGKNPLLSQVKISWMIGSLIERQDGRKDPMPNDDCASFTWYAYMFLGVYGAIGTAPLFLAFAGNMTFGPKLKMTPGATSSVNPGVIFNDFRPIYVYLTMIAALECTLCLLTTSQNLYIPTYGTKNLVTFILYDLPAQVPAPFLFSHAVGMNKTVAFAWVILLIMILSQIDVGLLPRKLVGDGGTSHFSAALSNRWVLAWVLLVLGLFGLSLACAIDCRYIWIALEFNILVFFAATIYKFCFASSPDHGSLLRQGTPAGGKKKTSAFEEQNEPQTL